MHGLPDLQRSRSPQTRTCLAFAVLLAFAGPVAAEQPLHQRIDEAIVVGKPDFESKAAPLAPDAEFLRRIYLDLAGTIPTAAETRAFLQDKSPEKRAQLINRLLASPAYARRLLAVFDVLLIERRPDKHVPRAQWQEYLRQAFAANKPYDEMVRELLSADGADPKNRAPARFYLDREAEPHRITRDVSRLFLGMNLQCAQCHDHPLVNGYKQDHYYGVYAFYSRTSLFTDKAKKQSMLAEKADGEVTYQSVFVPKVSHSTGPRLPDGQLVKDPAADKGKQYLVAPAKDIRAVPRYSRRAQLAGLVASADNVRFKRTAANRFWALMMGRGIVHPVDLDHDDNPPSHPGLLTLLAEDFAAKKFDVKAYLRELALSRTYQRSSAVPPGVKEMPADNVFALGRLRPLSPEQLAWSVMQATGLTDAERKTMGAKVDETALHAKLSANVAAFVTVFGSQPGEPATEGFEASLDQALFLRNGALVSGWLAPRPGNLTGRLAQLKESVAVAEEFYLSVLTRLPTADEGKEVADYLAGRTADRPTALQELAWALLTSAEFRFNH